MAGEKTEQPTEKKLAEARKEGRVPRSADFTGTAVMLGAGVALLLTLDSAAGSLRGLVERSIARAFAAETMPLAGYLWTGLEVAARVALPVLVVSFIVAAIVGYLQVGPVFATKPLVPDGSRLDLAEGWKRMVHKDRLVDLAKNLARLSVMILIAIAVYDAAITSVMGMPTTTLDRALPIVEQAAYDQSKFLLLALVGFSVLDLVWQRHKFTRELMMTRQEVTEEHRQTEGDPQVRARRKRMHRELSQSAGISAVEDADVVVVNPTHVAAAVRYRAEEMTAPTVVAAGRGAVAEEIRRRARRHRVPIVRDMKLARALADLEVDEEIPEDLFEAVAEVLHFVYSMSER